jgi:hypothetical protein
MPEMQSSEPHGHLKLGTHDLRQNLYRLFCYFYASQSLFDYADEDTGGNFVELRDDFEEMEIQAALVAVAVRLRIVEQEYRNICDLKEFGIAAGVLQQDIKTKKEEPLSLREACNKIVHADNIQFDRTFLDDQLGTFGALNPWVIIYGEKWNKKTKQQWRAKLEIKPFVNLGGLVCSGVYWLGKDVSTIVTSKPKPSRVK